MILGAGAIRSPQLLQVSGFGPKATLDAMDVPVKHENDQIGANFIDRNVATVGIVVEPFKDPIKEKFLGFSVSKDPETGLVYEAVGGPGVASGFAAAQAGFFPPEDRTKTNRKVIQEGVSMIGIKDLVNSSVMGFCLNPATKSRGKVVTKNTDVRNAPKTTANYYGEKEDLYTQYQCMEKLIEIINTSGKDTLGSKSMKKDSWSIPLPSGGLTDSVLSCISEDSHAEQTTPNMALPCVPYKMDKRPWRSPENPVTGNKHWEDWKKWIQKYTMTSYHYYGTTAAGTVVDAGTGAVNGVDGLYVVDASVMKIPTTVNPQATIMAVGAYYGEKIVLSLKEDLPPPPPPVTPTLIPTTLVAPTVAPTNLIIEAPTPAPTEGLTAPDKDTGGLIVDGRMDKVDLFGCYEMSTAEACKTDTCIWFGQEAVPYCGPISGCDGKKRKACSKLSECVFDKKLYKKCMPKHTQRKSCYDGELQGKGGKGTSAEVYDVCDCDLFCRDGSHKGWSLKKPKKQYQKTRCQCFKRINKMKDSTRFFGREF